MSRGVVVDAVGRSPAAISSPAVIASRTRRSRIVVSSTTIVVSVVTQPLESARRAAPARGAGAPSRRSGRRVARSALTVNSISCSRSLGRCLQVPVSIVPDLTLVRAQRHDGQAGGRGEDQEGQCQGQKERQRAFLRMRQRVSEGSVQPDQQQSFNPRP